MFKYFMLIAGGWLLTSVMTPLVRWCAIKLGAFDIPSDRKMHDHLIPRLGGFAIFFGFYVVFLLASRFGPCVSYLHDIELFWWQGPYLASGLIITLGAVDDVRSLKPMTKLLIQVIAAIFAVQSGCVVDQIAFQPGHSLVLGGWKYPLTVLWLVGLTNAFNLIDGLDGLASGTALIATATLGIVGILNQEIGLALVCAILAGCLLGFLQFNFYPASIFLGDSGSLFLGFILAILSTITSQKSTATLSILIPFLAFGLPIMDTLVTILRRLLHSAHVMDLSANGKYQFLLIRGHGIFEADRDHIHHRLVKLGLTHRGAVMILYGICLVLAVAGVLLIASRNLNTMWILLTVGVFAAMGIRQLRYQEFELKQGHLLPLWKLPLFGRELFQMFVDLFMVAVAYYLAYRVRFEGPFEGAIKQSYLATLPLVLLVKLIVFRLAGLYRIKWYYAGLPDLLRCVRAMLLGSVAITAILLLFDMLPVHKTVLIVDFYIMSSLLLLARYSLRLLEFYTQSNFTNKTRILIYGTDEHAVLLFEYWLKNPSIAPVGFIDDDPTKKGKTIHGYPVLGNMEELPNLLPRCSAEELIIAAPEVSDAQVQQIQKTCAAIGLKVRRSQITVTNLPLS